MFLMAAVRDFWMFLMAAVLATAASPSPLASDLWAETRVEESWERSSSSPMKSYWLAEVVAKMDGDRNRSPLLSVDAFPSLLYFKAGNSTPNVFHGNRTVSELMEFANIHGSQPLRPASLNLMQKGFKLQRSRKADL